jgi:transcriptional regulator with XRE-family HTH domain
MKYKPRFAIDIPAEAPKEPAKKKTAAPKATTPAAVPDRAADPRRVATGAAVSEAITRSKIGDRQLERESGLHRGTLNKIKSGQANVSIDHMHKIADAIGARFEHRFVFPEDE